MKYFNPETKIFQESSLLTGLTVSSDEAIICLNEKVIKGPTYNFLPDPASSFLKIAFSCIDAAILQHYTRMLID